MLAKTGRVGCIMDNQSIAPLVGSSLYQAMTDDSLKDDDNAAWVMGLTPYVRGEWIERIRWIRSIDRLAEDCLLYGHEGDENSPVGFSRFCHAWRELLTTGGVGEVETGRDVLGAIAERWFGADGSIIEHAAAMAWDRYLEAIREYHRVDLELETLADHRRMLDRLAGSFFQVLPFLTDAERPLARNLGILDQFYNNLRDLQEDARQGVCYFPREVLVRFGVTRAEILAGTAIANPGYGGLMEFWLGVYLPELEAAVVPAIAAAGWQDESWRALWAWSQWRYGRIRRVLEACDLDYGRFPQVYWGQVRLDLYGTGAGEVRSRSRRVRPGRWSWWGRLRSMATPREPAVAVTSGAAAAAALWAIS